MRTRLHWFKEMLFGFLNEVRRRAQANKQESILITHPTLLQRILTMPAMIPCFLDEAQVHQVIEFIQRQSELYHEGELITVDEDTFLRKIESILLHLHQDLLTERRAKFKIFHEELCMKSMEPARIERFASAAGLDFIDYISILE
jgi:hypothetical protein